MRYCDLFLTHTALCTTLIKGMSPVSPVFHTVYILLTACKMTTRWCIVAGAVSAKKQLYTTNTLSTLQIFLLPFYTFALLIPICLNLLNFLNCFICQPH